MCHQKFGYFKLIQKAIPIDIDLDDPMYEIDTSRVCIECESLHRQQLFNRYSEKERAEVGGEAYFSTVRIRKEKKAERKSRNAGKE